MFTCQEPSTRLNMLGFGGCGVTKNLFMDLEIERYRKSQNQIILRDLLIGVYQRDEAKLARNLYMKSQHRIIQILRLVCTKELRRN